MPEIFLPQKIAFGKDSLKDFSVKDYDSLLIVSDCDEPYNRYLLSMEKALARMISQPQLVVKKNCVELLNESTEIINRNEIDLIVAFGSAELIDTAMLSSYRSGADFVAIPTCSSCAMTDFGDETYSVYRKSPAAVVLDPQLISIADSQRLAYDAASCLAYSIDALIQCDNTVVYTMARDSAQGILKNIIPAFRGEIIARENLFYSMYFSVAAHRNIKTLSASPVEKITKFFAQLGCTKQSVAGMCIPNVMESFYSSAYAEIWRAVFDDKIQHTNEECAKLLVEKIRSIFASLSIPRSVKAFGVDESEYKSLRDSSCVSKDLFDLCFYGSFKFIKL